MSDVQQDLINAVSNQILRHLARQRSEECNPGFDPDRMDQIIAASKAAVTNLRRIREELEGIFSEPNV